MKKRLDFAKLSSHGTPEESPGFLLWSVSIRWRRVIEKVLQPLELTHPQFVVLATTGWLTRGEDRVTQADIGRLAGLDPNTTSQVLRGLEAKGLIDRSRSSDERSKRPVLTAMGAQRLAKALPAVEQADAKFFSSLDLNKSGILAALQQLVRSPLH